MKQNVNPIAATVVIIMTLGVACFIFYWFNRDKPIPDKFVDPNTARATGEAGMKKTGAGAPGGPAAKPTSGKPEIGKGTDPKPPTDTQGPADKKTGE